MVKTVVEVRSLVKKYGNLTAVDDVSFELYEGEVFAFLGPNGAGKTTTVEILECLRPLTSGEARVFGYDVTKRDDVKEIKKRIGVLPQDYSALDKLSVKENIDLIGGMYEKKLDTMEVIKLLDLEDKAKEKFENLSGMHAFLSGTYWPLEIMPTYLQSVARVLPLTYFSEGLRYAMIFKYNEGIFTNMAIVTVLAAVFIILGTLVTKWKEK